MTSGGKASWCARCRHMIVPAGRRGWVHYSDDDWAGAYSECGCALSLVTCLPEAPSVTARLARSAAGVMPFTRDGPGNGKGMG